MKVPLMEVDIYKLEQLLQANWTEFIDYRQMMSMVLEIVRNEEFRVLKQVKPNESRNTKITVTRVTINPSPNMILELCVEFTAPKQLGIVIGTVIFHSDLHGKLHLK
jgi:hypothetical protein